MKHSIVLVLALGVGACGEGMAPRAADSLRVKSVRISPASGAVYPGDTIRFRATVRDSNDQVVDVPVRWESATPSLLSIDSTGLATAHDVARDDSTRVIARAGIGEGSAVATIKWRAPFTVWPDTNVLFGGMTRTLVARLEHNLVGFPRPVVETVTASSWTSGDTTIVSVDGTGKITARSPGRTWIRAQWTDRTGVAWVQVSAPPPEPLRFISVSSGAVGLGFTRTEAHVEKGCGLIAWGDIYCWGHGMSLDGWSDRCEAIGRSGQSSYMLRRFACTEVPVRMFTPTSFYVMANNSSVGCAINGARRVFCWGSNRYGELGVGSKDTLLHGVTPIASGEEFRSVHISELTEPGMGLGPTVCAIRMDDALFCWGWGYTASPTRVEGASFRSFALAGRCGIASDGAMRCFESHPAFAVTGLRDVATKFTGGGSGDCALRENGDVHCGNGGLVALGEPAIAVTTYWNGVGPAEVCAITVSGVLRCGLSGTGSVTVFPERRWKSVFGNCGIASDDKTYCWRGSVLRDVPGQ